jgi:hypothetical protein
MFPQLDAFIWWLEEKLCTLEESLHVQGSCVKACVLTAPDKALSSVILLSVVFIVAAFVVHSAT